MFAVALTWEHTYKQSVERREGFPSWSWCGWRGVVDKGDLGKRDLDASSMLCVKIWFERTADRQLYGQDEIPHDEVHNMTYMFEPALTLNAYIIPIGCYADSALMECNSFRGDNSYHDYLEHDIPGSQDQIYYSIESRPREMSTDTIHQKAFLDQLKSKTFFASVWQ